MARRGPATGSGRSSSATAILLGWKAAPPSVSREPALVDPVALSLTAAADALAGSALDGLAARLPPIADYDERRMARTRKGLVFIVQFLAAPLLTGDQEIFSDFLNWLQICSATAPAAASPDRRTLGPPARGRGRRYRSSAAARARTPAAAR
jgi:hypothetical protein